MPSSLKGRILSVTVDRPVSQTRHLVLRSVGHYVHAVGNAEEALKSLEAGQFDLALVGHSIGYQQQRALTLEIKRRWRLPVIVIPHSVGSRIPEADREVEVLSDPTVLLSHIQDLLNSECEGRMKMDHDVG
jgi:hypothetical protein